MYVSKLNFKERPSKFLAITGIFAALFAIGNFIAIPGVASIEMIVTFVCAGIFGPKVALIASLAGEAIVMPIKPPEITLFIYSVFIGDAITALIMGYGRKLAFPLQKRFGMAEKRARMTGESIAYVLMLAGRYAFYTLFDVIVLYSGLLVLEEGADVAMVGFLIKNVSLFALKAIFLPACIFVSEAVRAGTGRVYQDLVLVEQPV